MRLPEILIRARDFNLAGDDAENIVGRPARADDRLLVVLDEGSVELKLGNELGVNAPAGSAAGQPFARAVFGFGDDLCPAQHVGGKRPGLDMFGQALRQVSPELGRKRAELNAALVEQSAFSPAMRRTGDLSAGADDVSANSIRKTELRDLRSCGIGKRCNDFVCG
jgi:hypothetical protein